MEEDIPETKDVDLGATDAPAHAGQRDKHTAENAPTVFPFLDNDDEYDWWIVEVRAVGRIYGLQDLFNVTYVQTVRTPLNVSTPNNNTCTPFSAQKSVREWDERSYKSSLTQVMRKPSYRL